MKNLRLKGYCNSEIAAHGRERIWILHQTCCGVLPLPHRGRRGRGEEGRRPGFALPRLATPASWEERVASVVVSRVPPMGVKTAATK